MLARQSHVVVSWGICCIRRAHYPKRSFFAVLSGRPGVVAAAATGASSSSSYCSSLRSSTVFGCGIGEEAPLSDRSFWTSSARMAGEMDGDEGSASHKRTNPFAKEYSSYLLQHAHNPVDWYPWGEEAFARARAEDKPIFLRLRHLPLV